MRGLGTILVIDDDPNDRLLIQEALQSAGIQSRIRVLHDGAEAISYLKGEGPYADREHHPYPMILITDLKMSGLDGLDVLEFLRTRPEFGIVPTVVFSSSSDPDDIVKAYTLGASSYHVKPTDGAAFAKQIKLLHDYWMSCEVPEVDANGCRKPTSSSGRIGERFSANPFPAKPAP